MREIIVKGKHIPIAGSTTFLIQGEIDPEETKFIFNTKGEHEFLRTAQLWKLWYKRSDGQGLPVELEKIESPNGTWYVEWKPDRHATYLSGQFTFMIAAYTTINDDNPVWKTIPCPITIVKSADPQIIDPDEKTLTYDSLLDQYIQWMEEQKGEPLGIATLDENGKLDESQIPGSAGGQEVYEGYLYNSKFYKDSAHTQEVVGKSEALYINKTASPANLYRYTGTEFKQIGGGGGGSSSWGDISDKPFSSIKENGGLKVSSDKLEADIITEWGTSQDNAHIPGAKLVKDSMDLIKFKISVTGDVLKIDAPASYVTGDTLFIGNLA